jgi:hypothetical protein
MSKNLHSLGNYNGATNFFKELLQFFYPCTINPYLQQKF